MNTVIKTKYTENYSWQIKSKKFIKLKWNQDQRHKKRMQIYKKHYIAEVVV